MTRSKIYELIDGERDHRNSKEEAIAKWSRRASAERVKELEQQVSELQGDIDDLREHRDSILLQLAETVAERDDLRTWSDEAAAVLTRGLELMPLDQLRQWQGAAAIQQAYYDIVRRGEAAMAVEDMDDWRADLEKEWPQMPDLEGRDIFPHLPISGKPESE